MVKLFAVQYGEMSEGGNIEGIFSSRARAVAFANKLADHRRCEVFDFKRVSENVWEGGCDYIVIEELELNKENF